MLSLKQAWFSLTIDQKKFLILIFVLMFFSMILEALSIGIIIPLLSIFLKGNLDLSAFSYFFTFFEKPKGNELIYVVLFVTMGVFLAKNMTFLGILDIYINRSYLISHKSGYRCLTKK